MTTEPTITFKMLDDRANGAPMPLAWSLDNGGDPHGAFNQKGSNCCSTAWSC